MVGYVYIEESYIEDKTYNTGYVSVKSPIGWRVNVNEMYIDPNLVTRSWSKAEKRKKPTEISAI